MGHRLGAAAADERPALHRCRAPGPAVAGRRRAHDGNARPHLRRAADHQCRHRRRSVENKGDGIFLAHDERYVVTKEFLDVYKALLAGGRVDYQGHHIRIEDGSLLFPPLQKPHPPLYFGGSSDAGIAVAAETVDTYLTWGEPPAEVAKKVEVAHKAAAERGRKLNFGIRLHVIVRETNEAAWHAADDLLKHLDDATLAAAQKTFERMDSVGQKRMLALHGGNRDKLEVSPNLWAGVGLVRGGAGTALVGDAQTVAERIKEYMRVGIDTFIFSGYPHLEEAYRFAELLFPLLPLAHASLARRHARRPRRRDHRQRPSPRRAGAGGVMTLPARSRELLDRLTPWLLPTALLIAWEGAARTGLIEQRVLPAPSDVAVAFWESIKSGALVHHVWISFHRAMAGLLIGGGIGFLLGVLNGTLRPAERLLDSSLQMLRNVPHLAIIPMVILWFGIDETAKIFLVAIGTLFPIYLNTFHGIRTIDQGLIDMAKVNGLGPLAIFWRVILPGAMPSVLVGLRYSLGIMWLTLIVAETIAASSGIGYMTMNAREFLQTDVVVLGIIVYALLGKAADAVTKAIEARALAWHPAYHAGHGAAP